MRLPCSYAIQMLRCLCENPPEVQNCRDMVHLADQREFVNLLAVKLLDAVVFLAMMITAPILWPWLCAQCN